jgi:hypothetical protein
MRWRILAITDFAIHTTIDASSENELPLSAVLASTNTNFETMLSGGSRTDLEEIMTSKLGCRKTKHDGNNFTHLNSVLHHLRSQNIRTLAISPEKRPLSRKFLGHTWYGRLHNAPQSQELRNVKSDDMNANDTLTSYE